LKEINKNERDYYKRLLNLYAVVFFFSNYVVPLSEIKGILYINLKVEKLKNKKEILKREIKIIMCI